MAAGKVSKNARREGAKELTSKWGGKITMKSVFENGKWGGKITMKSVFENGKMRHFAVCEKTGNQARKPRDLM